MPRATWRDVLRLPTGHYAAQVCGRAESRFRLLGGRRRQLRLRLVLRQRLERRQPRAIAPPLDRRDVGVPAGRSEHVLCVRAGDALARGWAPKKKAIDGSGKSDSGVQFLFSEIEFKSHTVPGLHTRARVPCVFDYTV